VDDEERRTRQKKHAFQISHSHPVVLLEGKPQVAQLQRE